MREHYAAFEVFNAVAAGQALATEPRSIRDVAHGDGEALAAQTTEVEVYPAAGAARITTPDARIELFRVPRYAVGRNRVAFFQGEDRDRTVLSVSADGTVLFGPTQDPAESPQTGGTAPGGPKEPSGSSTAAESPTAAGAHPQTPEAQEVPQIQLRGRLGRDPWHYDAGEQPMGGFPLAVNDGQGKTTWHKVVVYDEAAGQLHEGHTKGQILRGREVDVTGRPAVLEDQKPDGSIRKTKVFHATAVTVAARPPRRPRPV